MRFDVAVDVDGNKNNDINTNNCSNSIIINNNYDNNNSNICLATPFRVGR